LASMKSKQIRKLTKKLAPTEAGMEVDLPPVKAWLKWERRNLPPGIRRMEKRP